MDLNEAKVGLVLRAFLANIDYDLHKNIETPEDGTESRYPGFAKVFTAQLVRAHDDTVARCGRISGAGWRCALNDGHDDRHVDEEGDGFDA